MNLCLYRDHLILPLDQFKCPLNTDDTQVRVKTFAHETMLARTMPTDLGLSYCNRDLVLGKKVSWFILRKLLDGKVLQAEP
jgi:hypothetical protein